jgi:DNA-directed RNA polymerase subunit RPC12/RpoP
MIVNKSIFGFPKYVCTICGKEYIDIKKIPDECFTEECSED